MQTGWRAAGIFLIFLVVTGCSAETTGNVVGARENCRINGGIGFCEGRIRSLNGVYTKAIEDEFIFGGEPIDVTITASVEDGMLRVSFEEPSGRISSLEVNSDSPGTVVGVTEGQFDGFDVLFESLEGGATGVEYRIDYQTR